MKRLLLISLTLVGILSLSLACEFGGPLPVKSKGEVVVTADQSYAVVIEDQADCNKPAKVVNDKVSIACTCPYRCGETETGEGQLLCKYKVDEAKKVISINCGCTLDCKPVPVEVNPEVLVDAQETVTELPTEPVAETSVEVPVETVTETPIEVVPETAVETPVEQVTEPVSETPVEPVAEPQAEVPLETVAEAPIEAPVEPVAESVVDAGTELMPEVQVEPVVELVQETVVEQVAEVPVEIPPEKPACVKNADCGTVGWCVGGSCVNWQPLAKPCLIVQNGNELCILGSYISFNYYHWRSCDNSSNCQQMVVPREGMSCVDITKIPCSGAGHSHPVNISSGTFIWNVNAYECDVLKVTFDKIACPVNECRLGYANFVLLPGKNSCGMP